MTLCDRSDGAVVLELEKDKCRGGDLRDAAGVEADPAQGLESGFKQGVGALPGAVDAADDLVVRLLGLGQLTPGGLLDGVAEAVAGVLVAEVGMSSLATIKGKLQGAGSPSRRRSREWAVPRGVDRRGHGARGSDVVGG